MLSLLPLLVNSCVCDSESLCSLSLSLVTMAEALVASVNLLHAIKKNNFFKVTLHFAPFLLNAAMFSV